MSQREDGKHNENAAFHNSKSLHTERIHGFLQKYQGTNSLTVQCRASHTHSMKLKVPNCHPTSCPITGVCMAGWQIWFIVWVRKRDGPLLQCENSNQTWDWLNQPSYSQEREETASMMQRGKNIFWYRKAHSSPQDGSFKGCYTNVWLLLHRFVKFFILIHHNWWSEIEHWNSFIHHLDYWK